MNSVRLDGACFVNQVFVDHGDKRDVMRGSEVAKGLVKLLDVIRTVVGGQCDAGKENVDVGGRQRPQNGVKVVPRLREWQPPQTIISAKLNDDDGRVQIDDRRKTLDRILCRCAARSHVLDQVSIAETIEIKL